MNKLAALSGLLVAYAMTIKPCPTCIGRLERHAPPFFTDEKNTYYQEEAARTALAAPSNSEENQENSEEKP